jgi:ribosomal protein S18 acetylase RimI-like enzyme
MILYTDILTGISADQLRGDFFEGWVRPLTPETHLRSLHAASAAILAIDSDTGNVVGYVTILTDWLITAFIPNLEVLPGYRNRGIGTELMTRALAKIAAIPAVDLMCDPHLQPFYARLGMRPLTGMVMRKFDIDVNRQTSPGG